MAKFFDLLRGMGNKVKNTGSNLFDMLRRKEQQETEFAPLPKVEGADDRGLMPDGSFAQTQPLQLEHLQVDNNGQLVPNAQFHPMNTTQPVTNNGLFSKIANKTVDAVFGKQAPATDNVNANTMEVTVSDNPRVGGLINDITGGYRENRNNAFNLKNWGNNDLGNDREKGLAYRFGEGLGTTARGLKRVGGALGRFADTPLGRAAIMAGVVGATGGSGLQALAYGGSAGLMNQQNRMRDNIYRNQLRNLGVSEEDINSIKGYISSDVYKNVADSYKARWNKASWGDLASVNPAIAEAVKNNPELANSYLPASVANTILKGELTDAQIAHLMAKIKLAGIQGKVLQQNADANTLRANSYAGYMGKRGVGTETQYADLAEFQEILSGNDDNKIQFARNAYIAKHGKDPMKLIKQ